MDDPQEQDSTPKYMSLGRMSQYELSALIDDLASAADTQIHPQGEHAGLELVLCQLADQVQDLFGVAVQPDMAFEQLGHPNFEQQVSHFTSACAKAFCMRKGSDANIYQFRLLMKRALDASFVDSRDILRLQQPARTEIQQRLLQTQGRILHGIAHYTFDTTQR